MKKSFLIVLFLLFSIPSIYSTNIMGADIGYIYKGNNIYTITANIYRDCRGIPFNSPSGTAFGGNNGNNSCGSTNLTFVRKSIKDITTKCSTTSSPCNPQNQAANEGVEMHRFEVDIDISKAPYSTWLANGCCELTFAIGKCCRNGAITTAVSGDFIVTSSINICNVNKTVKHYNSAPIYNSFPNPFLCCNMPVSINLLANDTLDYSDSFDYRLSPALQTLPNNAVTYIAPYSYKFPIKPYCIPVSSITCTALPSAKIPRGIFLDSVNGDLIFSPTKCNEVAIVTIKVNEFRKDSSGKWINIGFTSRDMQYIVKDDCGYNNPPKITVDPDHYVCAGDKVCFKIAATDETRTPFQSTPDTVKLENVLSLPGAVFTIDNLKSREKTATFCWQTQKGDTSKVPYIVGFKASDQHCSRPSEVTRKVQVYVGATMGATPKNKIISCGKLVLNANNKNTISNAKYNWTVKDSANNSIVAASSREIDTVQLPGNGQYFIELNTNFGCDRILNDTVNLTNFGKLNNSNSEVTLCEKSKYISTAGVPQTQSPYTYKWQLNTVSNAADTGLTYKINQVKKDDVLTLKIKYGNNCEYKFTKIINVLPLPYFDITPDTLKVCKGIPVDFTANFNSSGTGFIWEDSVKSTSRTVTKEGRYAAKITSLINGCENFDTSYLFNNEVMKMKVAPIDKMCGGNQGAVVEVSVPNNNRTLIFDWYSNLNSAPLTRGPQIDMSPFNTNSPGKADVVKKIYVKAFDQFGSFTCTTVDSFDVVIHTPPKLVFTSIFPLCYNEATKNVVDFIQLPSKANLANHLTVYSRNVGSVWHKDSSILKKNNELDYSVQKNKITNSMLKQGKDYQESVVMKYTDTNSCYDIDSFKLEITESPELKFNDTAVCQENGELELKTLVNKSVLNKTNNYWTYSCIEVPSGVSNSGRIVNRGTFAAPNEYLNLGQPIDVIYSGLYKIDLSLGLNKNNCKVRDTSLVRVYDKIDFTHTNQPNLDTVQKAVNLLTYFRKNGRIATWEPGDKISITAYDGVYGKNPWNAKVDSNHYFTPKNQYSGKWRFVYTSKNACGVYQDSVELLVNGTLRINKITKALNFRLQPNPNIGVFEISAARGEGINELTISDLNGRIIYSQKLEVAKSSFKFNKSDLAKGVYLVTINKTVCLKMVINE